MVGVLPSRPKELKAPADISLSHPKELKAPADVSLSHPKELKAPMDVLPRPDELQALMDGSPGLYGVGDVKSQELPSE